MRIAFVVLTALVLFGATAAAEDANSLLESVHRSRTNWAGLPGFTARLKVFAEGKWQEGKLTVTAPDGVEITGVELDNERLVHGAIGSLVRHRYSEADSEPVTGMKFADEAKDHPLGRLIESAARGGGRFRIHQGVLREVLRETSSGKFTITVLDVYNAPDGKYLPQTYTVTFWDTEGQITRSSTIQNRWRRLKDWDLPLTHTAVRNAKGTRDVVRIEFSGHRITGE